MEKLIDPHRRHINYLRISVTDRCNLRCVYCMPEGGIVPLPHDDILRYEEIVKVVECAVCLGINKIRITGGEPLVRKGLVGLVERISQIAGIDEVTMTTNGILLSRYAKELAEAGLKRVNISLDTLNGDRSRLISRVPGVIRSVQRGIETALAVGLQPVKINVVVVNGLNDNEIEDFARLSYDRPLHVRFIELMPIANGGFYRQDRFLSVDAVLDRCQRMGCLQPIDGPKGGGPARYYKFDEAQGTVGFIGAVTHSFCDRCNRLRLTSDGRLKSCLGSEMSVDLKGVVGSNNDRALRSLFRTAVMSRPKGHGMGSGSGAKNHESMSQIGG
ncbi:MAG: GTP 3',8-cyclase MoaA [bacterium]